MCVSKLTPKQEKFCQLFIETGITWGFFYASKGLIMEFSFRDNFKELERSLSETANKELPFAIHTKLNRVQGSKQAELRGSGVCEGL